MMTAAHIVPDRNGTDLQPDTPNLGRPPLDRLAPVRYPMPKVPGTCRLRTQVTVKPGSRRHLTLEAFRAVGNAGSHPS